MDRLARTQFQARVARALASAAAAAVLAACATLPAREAGPPARTPETLASVQSLTGAPTSWPSVEWWRSYGDTQLNNLIAEGLSASPTLAAAEARLRAADAVVAETRANTAPALTLDGTAVTQKQSYNAGIPPDFVPQGYNGFARGALNFTYALDFWGRNRTAIAAATSDARAVAAETAQARLTLSTAIASSYADLAALIAERDIAAQALDVRIATADLVRRRVASGLDNRGELREAEAGPPTARAQIAALDEAIDIARHRLAALVGAGPDRGLAIAPPSVSSLPAFGLPTHLSADLIGRRPDIVAARWRAEAAERRLGVAERAFYPNIDLIAFVGAESLGLENFTRRGSDIGSIGPALSLPIFDGGRLRASLRRADAERDAAIAAYNGALTDALRDVADVATSERALATRLTESRAALAAGEDAYRVARLRYEGGLSTYQTVLIAEDAVLAQRLAVANLESRRFALDVALVRVLGGGFQAS